MPPGSVDQLAKQSSSRSFLAVAVLISEHLSTVITTNTMRASRVVMITITMMIFAV